MKQHRGERERAKCVRREVAQWCKLCEGKAVTAWQAHTRTHLNVWLVEKRAELREQLDGAGAAVGVTVWHLSAREPLRDALDHLNTCTHRVLYYILLHPTLYTRYSYECSSALRH